MKQKKVLFDKKEMLFCICFAAIAFFIVWRCKFGFAQSDESFYLSIPLRMYKGDVLLAEEWHLSQLTAFLYYPLVKLFLDITGSTAGLVMYMRYIYAGFHIIGSFYLFSRLKRFDTLGAALATVIFMLFTPNSMSTMYYFTIGIMCNTLFAVTIATSDNNVFDYVFSGLLFAAAVLCCPYLVIEFIVLIVLYIYIYIGFRKKKTYI